MDGSLPGSSVCGIFWARILEWVAISYCRWSFWPRDQPCLSCVSCIGNLGSQRHSHTCKSDQVSSKDLSLASHWLSVQDWAWQWLLQVALTCCIPPAGSSPVVPGTCLEPACSLSPHTFNHQDCYFNFYRMRHYLMVSSVPTVFFASTKALPPFFLHFSFS